MLAGSVRLLLPKATEREKDPLKVTEPAAVMSLLEAIKQVM